MTQRSRSYYELMELDTFEERYRYLALRGSVGEATFGAERHLNQAFYTSTQWRHIRQFVIARDEACDLAVEGYEIHHRLVIHHINPMTVDTVVHGDPIILDPENLITTTHQTHNAIHYGDERLLAKAFTERRPGDTKLW